MSARAQFDLDFALFVDEEDPFADLPWDSLSPDDFAPDVVERARHFFTENAFNEYASALAMSQMVTALGQAATPLPLVTAAAQFPLDELAHVALCARTAARLGGGAPFAYDPASLTLAANPQHSPLQRATHFVVRVCCLGEAVSLPLLSGNMRAARHPLPRAVFMRIVGDEARHARFGWRYLDWAAPQLTADDKLALGALVSHALAALSGALQPRRGGDEHVGAGLGWMAHEDWRVQAIDAIARKLVAPLRAYGIDVDWRPPA